MIRKKTLLQIFICLLIAGVLIFLFVGIYSTHSTSHSNPNLQTHSIIAKIAITLENYRSKYGRYPGGENKDISKELIENNLVYLSLDRDGNCIDKWGTPFKIYYNDGKPILISAGSNRKFDEINSPDDDDIRNY